MMPSREEQHHEARRVVIVFGVLQLVVAVLAAGGLIPITVAPIPLLFLALGLAWFELTKPPSPPPVEIDPQVIEDWVCRMERVAESLSDTSMSFNSSAEKLSHLPSGMREAAGTMLSAAQRMGR